MGKLKYLALMLILILILLNGCEYTVSEDKTGKSYQVKITEVDKNKEIQGDVKEVKEEGVYTIKRCSDACIAFAKKTGQDTSLMRSNCKSACEQVGNYGGEKALESVTKDYEKDAGIPQQDYIK